MRKLLVFLLLATSLFGQRWTEKAAKFRQSGAEPAALEADQRVEEYEQLAADLVAALPLLDVLPDVDSLAAEHRRRER